MADDGMLYGVFESRLLDDENQTGYTVLSVYQVLPYDSGFMNSYKKSLQLCALCKRNKRPF